MNNIATFLQILASRLSETSVLGTQGVCNTFEERKQEAKAVAGLESDQSVITVLSRLAKHFIFEKQCQNLPFFLFLMLF